MNATTWSQKVAYYGPIVRALRQRNTVKLRQIRKEGPRPPVICPICGHRAGSEDCKKWKGRDK